ncbi:MAG: aldose epimerase family protein [Sarcina sp.]
MKNIKVQKIYEKDGQDINEYIMSNDYMEIKILNFGGIIREINVENEFGVKENVVLAYKNIEDYFENKSYYGATIGRTAGRIAKGEIRINNKNLKLNRNYVTSQCHGGNEGFNKKFWNVSAIESSTESKLHFSYVSEDGEENYTGRMEVEVAFTLNNDNELKIEYKAKADKDTLANMTNHSYFNLSGNYKYSIENHDLYISSDSILEIDKDGIVTGKIINTKNSAFDFTTKKKIGKDIDADESQIKLGAGYDHPFNLNGARKIILEDAVSRRGMEVRTNNSTVVIYTMNYLDGKLGFLGKELSRRYGVCIETQSKPIGYDEIFKGESYLRAGEIYEKSTSYRFYRILKD